MFDSKQTLTGHLADAIDLTIDFATLGEYGLEPTEPPARACELRHRTPSRTRSTGAWTAAINRFASQV